MKDSTNNKINYICVIIIIIKYIYNILLREYGIKIRELFSDISDDDLDTEVLNLIRRNQRIGPNAVRARLISKGLKVRYNNHLQFPPRTVV